MMLFVLATTVGCGSGDVDTAAIEGQLDDTAAIEGQPEVPETLESHPIEDAATACKPVIQSAAESYSEDQDRFYLNADGALMFSVAADFPVQGQYLDCLFDELGTTEVIRSNVWSTTTDLGRQSEEHDGLEYQYSVQTNEFGGNELVIAIQETQ
jgi:hypothetical protein